MRYPALVTDTKKLSENIKIIQGVCAANGISFCAVTKCICAAPEITRVYYQAGVKEFADTRMVKAAAPAHAVRSGRYN
jgi:predicted amino acid racemase